MKPSVVRFTPAERWMHNIVMFSFVILLATGLAMIYFNLGPEDGGARDFLRLSHLTIAILYIAGPLLVLLAGGAKIWKENLACVFKFRYDDLKWLIKTPFVGIIKSIVTPPQQKFNGGQKVWTWLVIVSSIALTVTGVIIWLESSSVVALFAHTAISLLMIPAVSGHMYMALFNPDSRSGITAIIDGEVDAKWAQEHYPLWMDKKAKERVLEQAEIKEESAT